MSAQARADMALLARHDFPYFLMRVFKTLNPGARYLDNWHIYAIAWQLERIRLGEVTRLTITQPPRTMKSLATSVAWVAYLLGTDPALKIICVSYSSDLATNFARQFRQVVESKWYQQAFPGTKLDRVTDEEITTTRGGFRLTTSIGGTLTGRGADIIIIDDPMKAEDALSEPARKRVIDWYGSTLLSRLNDQRHGAIVLVMQRLHEGDLAGHVLSEEGWVHLDLPASAQETQRIQIGPDAWHIFSEGQLLHGAYLDAAALERLRLGQGTSLFSAQYLQRPANPMGNHIKWSWFRTYTEPPPLYPGQVVMSVDTASKIGENDYSVFTIWVFRRDQKEVLLVHVHRERLEYPELRATARKLIKEWNVGKILIEDCGSGTVLHQELRRELDIGVEAIIPLKDKPARFAAVVSMIERGEVHLPSGASWLPDFKQELLAFPNSRHDDQVDSVSQFLKWASDKFRQGPGWGEVRGLTG